MTGVHRRAQGACLLLAVALAGCVGLSLGARASAAQRVEELDGSFVQTWMGEGSEEGVAAAAARRRLLDSAANFGEAVLPGAYPPPAPAGPTVTFTAILGGATVASFTPAQQTKYTNLVKAQATSREVGATAATTVNILSSTKVPAGLSVRTQVVLPRGQNGPAQRLVVFLNVRPGADAPWLDAAWKGSSVSNAVSSVTCKAANCHVCPVNTNTCTMCRDGYTVDKGSCKRQCADSSRCTKCDKNPRVCEACVSSTGAGALKLSVYLNKQGECKTCTKLNCISCNNDGTCGTCKSGYERDGKGGCKETCNVANCDVCFFGGKFCKTCKAGYRRNAAMQLCVEVCDVANCSKCVAPGGSRCRTCAPKFRLTPNGQCRRA